MRRQEEWVTNKQTIWFLESDSNWLGTDHPPLSSELKDQTSKNRKAIILKVNKIVNCDWLVIQGFSFPKLRKYKQ